MQIEETLVSQIGNLEAVIVERGRDMEPAALTQRMEEMLMLKRQLIEYKAIRAQEGAGSEQE